MPRWGLNAGLIQTLPHSGFSSSSLWRIFHLSVCLHDCEYLTLEEGTKQRKGPAKPPGCHCSLRLHTLRFSLQAVYWWNSAQRLAPTSDHHRNILKSLTCCPCTTGINVWVETVCWCTAKKKAHKNLKMVIIGTGWTGNENILLYSSPSLRVTFFCLLFLFPCALYLNHLSLLVLSAFMVIFSSFAETQVTKCSDEHPESPDGSCGQYVLLMCECSLVKQRKKWTKTESVQC